MNDNKTTEYIYKFTIFTPTYNRAHTLDRVYNSLMAQTYKDFEWLIVDDGSTDNTKELINKFKEKSWFPIHYHYQKNRGKHTAINVGVQKAQGQLFLILDSDDACVSEALERFNCQWEAIPENERASFSAITALCKNQNGEVISDKFPHDILDSNSLELFYVYKVKGEKWGFHRTDVMKEFPFPEPTEHLSFVPESLVWMKIARKYKTRFINEVLRIYYIENNEISLCRTSPKKNAYQGLLMHQDALNNNIDYFFYSPKEFIRSLVHFVRFSLHLKIGFVKSFHSLNNRKAKLLFLIFSPLGILVYLKDKLKN